MLSQDDVATVYAKSQELLEKVQQTYAPLLDASVSVIKRKVENWHSGKGKARNLEYGAYLQRDFKMFTQYD